MIYEEIDLFHNQRLIDSLNKIVATIGYEPSKVESVLYRPEVTLEYARERVSEESLTLLQKHGSRDVATQDCNLYKFNNISFDWLGAVLGASLPIKSKALGVSGRIWYPVNGYMGWHTNNDNQGIKLYCTHSRESGKSFFRYQHPDTKEIITSWDKQGWNFRLFKVQEQLLWHCVYSETDRISIGYTLI